MTRFLALTIPAVTVLLSPNGFPTATTQSPTRRRSESPRLTAVRVSLGSIFTRAMSVLGSRPMILAGYSCLLVRVTVSSLAPSTTWLLVTMSPSLLMTNPLPAPCCRCSRGICGIWPPKNFSMKSPNGRVLAEPFRPHEAGAAHLLHLGDLDIHDAGSDSLHQVRETSGRPGRRRDRRHHRFGADRHGVDSPAGKTETQTAPDQQCYRRYDQHALSGYCPLLSRLPHANHPPVFHGDRADLPCACLQI